MERRWQETRDARNALLDILEFSAYEDVNIFARRSQRTPALKVEGNGTANRIELTVRLTKHHLLDS